MTERYPIPEFLRRQPSPVVTPRERPILFSAPMIRALLAGSKTQTRRCLYTMRKFSSTACIHRDYLPPRELPPVGHCWALSNWRRAKAGDRLWVRENWSADPLIDDSWASTEWNGCGRKVREIPERFHHPRFCNYAADWLHEPIRWTPSIHMPRWASRILLEIVAVRVEQLQDISGSDAANEGVRVPCDERGRPLLRLTGKVPPSRFCAKHPQDWTADDYLRFEYAELWEQINGPGSWAANPWVWCLTFKRV